MNQIKSKKFYKLKRTVFVAILENVLIQRRKRIIDDTVTNFHHRALIDFAFNRFKLYQK